MPRKIPFTEKDKKLVNRKKRFKGPETQPPLERKSRKSVKKYAPKSNQTNLHSNTVKIVEELEEGEIPPDDPVQTPLSSFQSDHRCIDEIKIKNEPVEEEESFGRKINIKTEPEEIFAEYSEPLMNIVKEEELMIDAEQDHVSPVQPPKSQVQVPSEGRASVSEKQIDEELKKTLGPSNCFCPLCLKIVKYLRFHMSVYHSGKLGDPDYYHTCKICEKKVQTKDIYSHTATRDCQSSYSDWKALQLHRHNLVPRSSETLKVSVAAPTAVCLPKSEWRKNSTNVEQLPLVSCPLCLGAFEIDRLRNHFTSVHPISLQLRLTSETLQTCLLCNEQVKAKDMYFHSFSSTCKSKCESLHYNEIFNDWTTQQQPLRDEHPQESIIDNNAPVPSSGKLPESTEIKVKTPEPPKEVEFSAPISPLLKFSKEVFPKEVPFSSEVPQILNQESSNTQPVLDNHVQQETTATGTPDKMDTVEVICPDPDKVIKCFRCKEVGHLKDTCTNKRKRERRKRSKRGKDTSTGAPVNTDTVKVICPDPKKVKKCFRCDQKGHLMETCTNKRKLPEMYNRSNRGRNGRGDAHRESHKRWRSIEDVSGRNKKLKVHRSPDKRLRYESTTVEAVWPPLPPTTGKAVEAERPPLPPTTPKAVEAEPEDTVTGPRCYNCQRLGHIHSVCKNPRVRPPRSRKRKNRADSSSEDTYKFLY